MKNNLVAVSIALFIAGPVTGESLARVTGAPAANQMAAAPVPAAAVAPPFRAATPAANVPQPQAQQISSCGPGKALIPPPPPIVDPQVGERCREGLAAFGKTTGKGELHEYPKPKDEAARRLVTIKILVDVDAIRKTYVELWDFCKGPQPNLHESAYDLQLRIDEINQRLLLKAADLAVSIGPFEANLATPALRAQRESIRALVNQMKNEHWAAQMGYGYVLSANNSLNHQKASLPPQPYSLEEQKKIIDDLERRLIALRHNQRISSPAEYARELAEYNKVLAKFNELNRINAERARVLALNNIDAKKVAAAVKDYCGYMNKVESLEAKLAQFHRDVEEFRKIMTKAAAAHADEIVRWNKPAEKTGYLYAYINLREWLKQGYALNKAAAFLPPFEQSLSSFFSQFKPFGEAELLAARQRLEKLLAALKEWEEWRAESLKYYANEKIRLENKAKTRIISHDRSGVPLAPQVDDLEKLKYRRDADNTLYWNRKVALEAEIKEIQNRITVAQRTGNDRDKILSLAIGYWTLSSTIVVPSVLANIDKQLP